MERAALIQEQLVLAAIQIRGRDTESRCKTSTSRLKGRGRRWDARNAERVAALTTLKDSDQWNLYWNDANPETEAA
jgi:hypothetical protein